VGRTSRHGRTRAQPDSALTSVRTGVAAPPATD
jgi:hypothetical protein